MAWVSQLAILRCGFISLLLQIEALAGRGLDLSFGAGIGGRR